MRFFEKNHKAWLRIASSTFAADIRTEPLRGVVVEEAFGVGEPHGEVAGVASVLQHRLQWEGIGVG